MIGIRTGFTKWRSNPARIDSSRSDCDMRPLTATSTGTGGRPNKSDCSCYLAAIETRHFDIKQYRGRIPRAVFGERIGTVRGSPDVKTLITEEHCVHCQHFWIVVCNEEARGVGGQHSYPLNCFNTQQFKVLSAGRFADSPRFVGGANREPPYSSCRQSKSR